MSESNIQKQIMLALSQAGVTVWRQNTGQAWVGEATKIFTPGSVRVSPGDVVIRNARPLHAGLCRGSSDLIGLQPVVVTESMMGQLMARFVAVEVKAPRGRVSDHQQNFIDHVSSRGGAAGVARSPDEALGIIQAPGNT